MPDTDSSRFEWRDGQLNDPLETELAHDKDLVMEQILDNIHGTPLGQVLKKIASLPEIRRKKRPNSRRKKKRPGSRRKKKQPGSRRRSRYSGVSFSWVGIRRPRKLLGLT